MDTRRKQLRSATTEGRGVISILIIAGMIAILTLGFRSWLTMRAERQALRQETEQLRAENQRLSNVAQTLADKHKISAAMSASIAPPDVTPANSLVENPSNKNNNLIARIIAGEDEPPELTAEQAESYLEQTRRSAASLLAAFRGTRDEKFLQEALQKFPGDPQVNFAAAIKQNTSPEERRERLDSFKQSAPENALANYLSSLDYFKSGQTALAVQELSAASGKLQMQDYSMEFVQNAEEAYRAAGYSESEAKMIAMSSLLLPHLAQMRDLGRSISDLVSSYREAGDQASADEALQMACKLGQRFDQQTREPLISQLVGAAIERTALSAMDPASPYANGTVNDRLAEMTQQRASMKQLTQQFDSLQPMMSADDWSHYADRQRLFGEKAALQWLAEKYGPK
jgi:hypothetical protein